MRSIGELLGDAERLAGGEHHDPHGLLGPHRDGASLVIRAWQPGADGVTLVLADGRERPMRPVGDEGLFAVRLRRTTTPSYRFDVARDGVVHPAGDPYRFAPTIGQLDLHLIGEGTHRRLWDALGARPRTVDGVAGVAFAVWAPAARGVAVVGDFNGWDERRHPLRSMGATGVWELFVPDARAGDRYKLVIHGADGGVSLRADPLAREAEVPPATASIVAEARHAWSDDDWMATRGERHRVDRPMSVYELHLGSWRAGLDYRSLAETLPAYVAGLGFTHVELMPVMAHPFGGSWGYQVTGYYAVDSRLGTPDDLRHLIDRLHAAGIGVILDWVPGHFPRDEFALARFDGTALYEHADPRLGAHPDWGTLIFNYGRTEVRNFLVANALYWLSEFHADGLRVDAVASMLYLDYSRAAGEWLPNVFGGNENLAAIDFLREMNTVVYAEHPDAFTAAEESTAWPGVSRPVHDGGLGFGFKWNMGFMHDTLSYIGRDPIYRSHHHDDLTRPLLWAFDENYVLPVSHDEVVHGKGSLYGRMPGDDWQKRANLRAYLAWLWTQPGKKLIFMGCEIAQHGEWNHDRELDWPGDAGVSRLVHDLNALYRARPALFATDADPAAYAWSDVHNAADNVAAFVRTDAGGSVAIAANFAPVVREGYRLRLPHAGPWHLVLDTDAAGYGGSGVLPAETIEAVDGAATLTLPPLAVVVYADGEPPATSSS
jgi:1,4-alpha-glucan branching enzyme